MSGAALNRGGSKQDYETPPDLIAAVERRFGPLAWDLASDGANAKAPNYLTEREDALATDWNAIQPRGVMWLNPPFDRIDPWAAKCARHMVPEFGQTIVMLTPASVGTEWYAEHAHGRAYVLALSPRLVFLGQREPEGFAVKHPGETWRPQGYPKDLMLTVWGGGHGPGFAPWRYR